VSCHGPVAAYQNRLKRPATWPMRPSCCAFDREDQCDDRLLLWRL
jgi:hypothetical protein